MSVAFAMPCRTDEPALAATLGHVAAAWRDNAVAPGCLLVCVNGPGPLDAKVVTVLRTWSAQVEAAFELIDVDQQTVPPVAPTRSVRVLRTQRAGKANAWNLLRRALRATAVAVFLDADVDFAADVPARLVHGVLHDYTAILASARTQPIVRPSLLERLQAVPYQFPFANLSPQLYAARVARLPPAMPDDLLDPERWLELIVGWQRIVLVPQAIVLVGLAATGRDFFRQRIRLEHAKIQLALEYPGLAQRGRRPPTGRAVGAHYSAGALALLAGYMSLRTLAHGAAWWRHRQGRLEVAWRQATSTKERH